MWMATGTDRYNCLQQVVAWGNPAPSGPYLSRAILIGLVFFLISNLSRYHLYVMGDRSKMTYDPTLPVLYRYG